MFCHLGSIWSRASVYMHSERKLIHNKELQLQISRFTEIRFGSRLARPILILESNSPQLCPSFSFLFCRQPNSHQIRAGPNHFNPPGVNIFLLVYYLTRSGRRKVGAGNPKMIIFLYSKQAKKGTKDNYICQESIVD